MRHLKRCWEMSLWSWPSPVGIEDLASSVQGPSGTGAWAIRGLMSSAARSSSALGSRASRPLPW